MAIRPDYQVGTLNLEADSADFTTTGSALEVAAVQAGDAIIAPSGHILIIASITGQNSGTLFLPCPSAAAGTDLPLRIRFQPDGSRYQGSVRDLVEKLANGVLENIADIPVEDGNLLVGNAAGQYEPISKDDLGVQDPNGNLGELAALPSVDNLAELADITLAADKILNTDAAGNLTQSDITAAALVLFKLAGVVEGNKLPFFDSANSAALTNFTAAARALINLSGAATADMLPYLTGANGAGLTALTAFARTILDDADGAAMFATMGATALFSGSGCVRLPNKLIFQWSDAILKPEGVWVPFPIGFPNSAFQTIVGCSNGSVVANVSWGVPADKNGFTGYASAATGANYIAIGW
ncbi:hypothetical protein [Brucella sp. BO2]|uniref:gp53-like domain-containing protein n=1 Tax=Brucella sp. BO2 TaxID=693750 RepID=UPI0002F189BA|nr:hypothetical protein [Brucella sp. BO2]